MRRSEGESDTKKMSFDEAKGRLLEVLAGHIGEEHTIGMDVLYEAVFGITVTHKINHTRPLRRLVTALRKKGVAIGSVSSSDGGGYYLIRAASELDDYCMKMLRRPALRKLAMEARIRKIALPELLGQMVMNLEGGGDEAG